MDSRYCCSALIEPLLLLVKFSQLVACPRLQRRKRHRGTILNLRLRKAIHLTKRISHIEMRIRVVGFGEQRDLILFQCLFVALLVRIDEPQIIDVDRIPGKPVFPLQEILSRLPLRNPLIQ